MSKAKLVSVAYEPLVFLSPHYKGFEYRETEAIALAYGDELLETGDDEFVVMLGEKEEANVKYLPDGDYSLCVSALDLKKTFSSLLIF